MSSVSESSVVSDNDSCEYSPSVNSQVSVSDISHWDVSDISEWCDSDVSSVSDYQDQTGNSESPEIEQSQHIEVIFGVSEISPSSLPPPPWYEEYTPRPSHLPSVRQTVRRDSRLLTSASLPSFSAPNCRSIFPKIRSIVEDMRMRSINCILASESWEKSASNKYKKRLRGCLKWRASQ